MRYDELSNADKARVNFLNKMESEGGLEAMYRWGGFKETGLPFSDRVALKDLADAFKAMDKIITQYAILADSVTYDEDQ